ncbi:MarR family winged helix-turn-helix transcriptional regulator [Histidinibacterium aquaticum]|uniref:MarR family winged helix-turn-helix transcriptional regulator n=1 Tax=Histidinibacterium aquaticum TaxID=2613962 RepID=UPI00168A60CA|nr:MarR family transcriptional regulator [Histidinibacterium aquaticum]
MTDPTTEDSVSHIVREWRRERPDFDAGPIGVFARILRLSGALSQRTKAWLDEEGLSWEAFSLIVTLRRQGAPYRMRPSSIIRESLLTSGAVTNRIDRVEKLGLVERAPDPDDRRAVSVQLTEAGLEKADAAIAAHVSHLHEVLEPLGEEQLEDLDRLLTAALSMIETENGSADQGPR